MKKIKLKELDVDFINSGPLTDDDKKKISKIIGYYKRTGKMPPKSYFEKTKKQTSKKRLAA